MNPSIKNAVVAGVVALVVAFGVILGARAFPSDNSGVASVSVMSPDGSVIGTTAPIRMASSGPPVPACSVVNTKLNCQGAGLPFDWVPVSFGDAGTGNAAFGVIIPGSTDAGTGFLSFAKATLTPISSGNVEGLAAAQFFSDASLGSPANGFGIIYAPHGTALDAGNSFTIMGSPLPGVAGVGFANTAAASALGVASGLIADGGTSYDFYLIIALSDGGFNIPSGTTGGIYVREIGNGF